MLYVSPKMNQQQNVSVDKIGIVAGSGNLPPELAQLLRKKNVDFYIAGIENFADQANFIGFNYQEVNIAKIGKLISYLKTNSVNKVIFIGGLARPKISSLKPDLLGVKLLAELGINKISGGDDNVLRIIIDFFQKQNFYITSIAEIAPEILAEAGHIAGPEVNKTYHTDIQIGTDFLHKTSEFDVGQAVILQNKRIIGVEAAEGTDGLIKRMLLLKFKPENAILIKTPKATQDKRIDLPTIGPETVKNCYESGVKLIAVKSGETIIQDKLQTISLANELKISIIGI
jgi:DUF1009 family protein